MSVRGDKAIILALARETNETLSTAEQFSNGVEALRSAVGVLKADPDYKPYVSWHRCLFRLVGKLSSCLAA